jgi:opacity protein-like surface antigen
MRRLICLVAIVGVLAWAGAAEAVVGDTTVSVGDGGKPIQEAKVTLTFKDGGGKTIRKVTRTTTRTGKRTVRIPDRTEKVDIVVTTRTGKQEIRTDIPVAELLRGEFVIDIPGGATPPGTPGGPGTPAQPPLNGAPSDGPMLSFYALGVRNTFEGLERVIGTGETTFSSSDSGSSAGGGVGLAGPNLMPGNGTAVNPFVAFDILDQSVHHNFPNGNFYGERVRFIGTAGLQAGWWVQREVQVYVLGGVAIVNKEFTISFLPTVTTDSQWLWGGTLGIGIAVQPAGWRIGNRPVRLFAQYQHVWVQDGKLNDPPASPGFDYRFGNDMDLIKFGFAVALMAP